MIFMPFPRFVAPISDPPPLAMTKVASMKHSSSFSAPLSESQAGGGKPIAPHFATRDAGQGRDGPPDTRPGESGFSAPDAKFAGLQIVADCAAGEPAGAVVNAA